MKQQKKKKKKKTDLENNNDEKYFICGKDILLVPYYNKNTKSMHCIGDVFFTNKGVKMSLVELFLNAVTSGQIEKVSMPNIPFWTFGGKVFWNELASQNGWRLQKNMITGHCRILNPADIRVVWGGEEALLKLFEQLNK